MTTDPLARRVADAFTTADHRWHTRPSDGVIVTPPITREHADELAAMFAPIFRDLVERAVEERLPGLVATEVARQLRKRGAA